jgi:hypothetical protein
MQRDQIRTSLLGAPLAALLTIGMAPTAQAGDDQTRAAEILAHIDDPAQTREWFRFDRDWLGTHFGIKSRSGVQWRHTIQLKDRKLKLSIHGPVQRGVGRTHLGLGFQIKF